MSKTTNKRSGEPSNAQRFIQAYNSIDYSLRAIYGFKRNLTFSDIIRRAVTLNSVVRKYEETLVDYARLRNSIVHKSNPNYVIAEPHIEVVEEMEKIAKLIATPPKALDKVCNINVLCISHDSNIRDVITIISETGYSNIPVYNGKHLIGVINRSILIEHLGHKIKENIDLDKYLEQTSIESILGEDKKSYYHVANKDLTIESALNKFYTERKLESILITENGTENELPLGIITAGDVLDMNEVLENYES